MGLSQQDDTEKTEKGWHKHCMDDWQCRAQNQHKFYNLLKSENLFPTFFQIQTTNSCNGRCVMCPYTYKNKNETQYMNDELFKKIILELVEGQKLIKKRIEVNLMLQNEPFLDKNLIKKIRFIKQFDNFFVTTLTNGSLLNKDTISDLETSGIDLLTISIDSINKKTFEEIRLGLDFDKIMQNVELLKNSSIKNKIKIRFTLQKKNQKERKDFFHFWKSKGIKTQMCHVTNRCGTLKVFDDVKVDDKGLLDSFENFSKEYNAIRIYDGQKFLTTRICFFHFYRFNILANGDVINCCHDWGHEDIAGNIQENTIKDIWQSKFKEYRQLFLKGRSHEIPVCGKCSLYNRY